MLSEQWHDSFDSFVSLIDYQSPKSQFNLGERIMICCLQAIKINAETMNAATFGDLTAIVIPEIKQFKAEPAVLCSKGTYIDIYIKQVRHTTGFDLTKDELIKAEITHYLTNDPVTFIEWEKL